MSLWDAITHPSQFGDYLFMPSGAVAMQEETNRHQEARIKEQYAQGIITPEEYDDFMARVSDNTYQRMFQDPANKPSVAFVEGAKVGWENLIKTTNNTLGWAVSQPFRIIPWQVWLLLALGLVVYVGINFGIFRRLAGKVGA